MHELIVFLYCCAKDVPIPTPHNWWQQVCTFCNVIIPEISPPVYDTDPMVLVSLVHSRLEPDTLVPRDIMARFVNADVSTRVWGPPGWKLLHDLAQSERYMQVKILFGCWKEILPCHECRTNLRVHINTVEYSGISTSDDMYKYTVALHNAVNTQLGKSMWVREPINALF